MRLPEPQTQSTSTTAPAASLPTWELAFSEGRDLFALWGKNDKELFAVGDAGTVLCSINAGLSWNQIKLDTTNSLYAIWGLNDTLFVAGAGGVLFRSRDSGKTWSLMKDTTERDLLGVWGSSEDNIYVVGKNGTILHAIDGATFALMPTPSQDHLYGVWGSDDKNVYTVGSNGLILRSLDQGKSWQKNSSNSGATLRSIWGRSAHEIYALGHKLSTRGIPPQTEVLASIDGVTWKSTLFGGEGRALFGDNTNVYAVGPYVSVFSSDQGLTWKPWIAANQHEALREMWGLWVSSTGQAFISGQRGLLLKLTATSPAITMLAGTLYVSLYDSIFTSDGALLASGWQGNLVRWKGDSLELLRSNSDATLGGLARLQDTLFALGSAGALLSSEDNGTTWKLLPTLGSRSIQKLFAIDKLFALATDSLFTSTNGERWSIIWRDFKKNVHAVSQSNERWYLFGDDGFTASSADLKNWKTQNSNTTQDLFTSWAATETEVFAAGAVGTIIYTLDGGETWQLQQSNVNRNLTDMIGLSATEVLIVGSGGTFLRTKDAGKTWREEVSPAPRDLFAVSADERFIYVAGDGILARYPRLALQ